MAADAPTANPHDASASSRRTMIRPRTGWQMVDFGEIWRTRDLLFLIAARDVKVRYKQTFFGYGWAVVVPSVQVLVFSVFFGSVLGVSEQVDAAAGKALPYPLFALTGQIVWNFFNASFTGASGSLMANANIIRKVYVPRLLLPLASVGKPSMDAVVVWFLMLGLLAYFLLTGGYDVHLTWKIVFSPLLLVAAYLPAIALGLIAAALTVNYRDLQSILPFVVSILFYLTPVIYSVELLPGLPQLALVPQPYRRLRRGAPGGGDGPAVQPARPGPVDRVVPGAAVLRADAVHPHRTPVRGRVVNLNRQGRGGRQGRQKKLCICSTLKMIRQSG